MATFVVAVDGSKNSHEAFDTACKLLNRKEDQLLIVTCAEKLHQARHLLNKDKEAEALAARIERAQKAILSPFRELAEERGIKSTCLMLKGNHAGSMLCTLVDERNADFLVVGRYGSRPSFPFPLQSPGPILG
jgi:nucleotide-binding universal stress UspA family protein